MTTISDKLIQVQDNIAEACVRSSRAVGSVTTVVVTKTAPLESVKEVIRLGCLELGENRVQHLQEVSDSIDEFLHPAIRQQGLPASVNWHMIGHLQRNKVKQTLPLVKLIHSVDTLRLAEEISQVGKKLDITSKILLQVNCSLEPNKHGVPVGAAVHLAEQILTLPNIEVTGLMTMAPLTKDESVIRRCFARARELFEDIKAERFIEDQFRHLSMGMSNDYEIAVEEGATILRIGSAFFH